MFTEKIDYSHANRLSPLSLKGVLHCYTKSRRIPAPLGAAEWVLEQWSLTVRFDSRESLAAFRVYCNDHGLDFELDDMVEDTQPRAAQYDLSTPQYGALLTAFEMGYFNIPRDATLGEVADYFDISTHAASERLRRGQTNLIAKTLSLGRSADKGA